jgi:hypothetical protein
VPRMFPKLAARSQENSTPAEFSVDLYLKHREYNALLGALAMTGALILKLVLLPR